MAKQLKCCIYPEDLAERMAKIMGQNSATARALAEMKRRRAEGEEAVLLISGPMIFVGPRPAPAVME